MRNSSVRLRRGLERARRSLRAASVENFELDADLLFCFVLGIDRAQLYLSLERELSAREATRIDECITRRASGEPLQYIVGKAEFMGLPFKVGPGVLVPRPETETLVEELSKRIEGSAVKGLRLWDVGTGCGAIALSMAHRFPELEVFASDLSETALEYARSNAESLGVAVTFGKGPLLEPALGLGLKGKLEVITFNPPYVRSGDFRMLPREVRDHEPREALDGGADGLDLIRAFVEDAPEFVTPGGMVVMEIGAGQAERVSEILSRTGRFASWEVRNDLAGIPRVVLATAGPAAGGR